MDTPLLTTKLYIPPIRPEWVSRPRLLRRLDDGLHGKLILVSAPAGFGKTTLLSEWLSLPSENRVAWLSLDEADNDPVRFLSYLLAAFRATKVAIADQASPAAPLEATLTALINQVGAGPGRMILVLDDYHLIGAQPIHQALEFLLEHQPPNLSLVIASRADPPLSLPRLRARGQLTELRQRDLRFTAAEAAVFLNSVMGLDLSAQDVSALEQRTEGWIAGLQMAALSLQGAEQNRLAQTHSQFVQAFTGSHRFVLDYLVEEVLEQQPPALQEFLLKTSILERLTAPLCDAVVGTGETGPLEQEHPADPPIYQSANSQATLEHLEAANLFIVPLDSERRWYRYHRLFADLLQQRLKRTRPDLVPLLHRRASEWHEQQGLMADAIDHALAAQDLDRALILIEDSMEATLMRSEIATFLNWVEKLPDEWVNSRPLLCFFYAWAQLMSGGSIELVEQRLQNIARTRDALQSDGAMAGRMLALDAYLMLFQANVHGAAELCRQALERLPEGDLFLRSIVVWLQSLARLTDRDPRDGSQTLQEVIRLGQKVGNPLIVVASLCHQAELQARQGHLHRARQILEQALHLATDPQGRRLPIAGKALIGLAELEREWDDLAAATDYLTEAIDLSRQWSELATFDAYIALTRVRQAQGDGLAAAETLEIARQIALRSGATEMDDLIAELQQAELFVSQGNLQEAMRWAEKRRLLPRPSAGPVPEPAPAQGFVEARLRKYEQLVLARLFILQDRAADALELLDTLLARARQLGRIDLVISCQVLRALALQAQGLETQALDALDEALSLAEPGGHVRIFVDHGEPMARLLRQASSRGLAPAYVARLLAAWAEPPSEAEPRRTQALAHQAQPLVEPLSERELEVLRLLATGLSNPEIADELYIAVSTVRSHCKNIYGKLDVHKRWDAVQRGRNLGLI